MNFHRRLKKESSELETSLMYESKTVSMPRGRVVWWHLIISKAFKSRGKDCKVGTFDPGAPAGTACGPWGVSEARGALHEAVAHPWSKDIRA